MTYITKIVRQVYYVLYVTHVSTKIQIDQDNTLQDIRGNTASNNVILVNTSYNG